MIKSYRPQCIINITSRAKPSINGTNFASYSSIRVTDYLGDNGSVEIVKTLTTPMGAFSIQIPDKPLSGSAYTGTGQGAINDSLFGFIQPMDWVEIQLSHEPGTAEEQPIMMRGIVTNVSRSEAIGSDGSPQRVVSIQGNDLGLVFSLMRLVPPSSDLSTIAGKLSGWQLVQELGIDGTCATLSVKSFYEKIINKVNEWMDANEALSGAQFTLDCKVAETTGVMVNKWDPTDSAIWNIMVQYLDPAFNELFVEDREDGTYLNVRPKPYYDITSGGWIQIDQSEDPLPEIISIDIEDIIELTGGRTDAKVFNFPLMKSAAFPLNQNQATFDAMKYVEESGILEYVNCKVSVYGFRFLDRPFVQVPIEVQAPMTNQKEAVYKQNIAKIVDFNKARIMSIFDMVKDNVIFEEGTMTLFGNHMIMPGRYLDVTRGVFSFQVYVEEVSHQFTPYGAYTTTVKYVRGTGYAKRMQSENSPYLAEGRRGVY